MPLLNIEPHPPENVLALTPPNAPLSVTALFSFTVTGLTNVLTAVLTIFNPVPIACPANPKLDAISAAVSIPAVTILAESPEAMAEVIEPNPLIPLIIPWPVLELRKFCIA